MNTLYPIFLKPDKLNLLIVGGGQIGYEKLFFIFKNSPDMNLEIIAEHFCENILEFVKTHKDKITIKQKIIEKNDLFKKNLIVAATNDQKLNSTISIWANEMNILINVADTPNLCDFYLSSIVTKGDLKIAISTNGKSPTFAKRFREILEDIIPNSTNSLIKNLNSIRNELKINFMEKVEKLNEITSTLRKHK